MEQQGTGTLSVLTRVYLTPELVDGAMPPLHGELWLADTLVRGFGVRVWAGTEAAGKAYCVRVADQDGRFVRRTLKKWELWDLKHSTWRFLVHEDLVPTIGTLLEEARAWARDEIDRIQGRATLEEEERSQWARSAKQAQKITLARAAQAVSLNLEIGGRSQAYRDRLDKLFGSYVPEEIQNKRLVKLTSKDIAKVLQNPNLSVGNMRTLRPFLGKCIELGRRFRGGMHRSLWDFERRLDIGSTTVVHPMMDWTSDQFRMLLTNLASDDIWQQGLCISLYFETREALTTAMAARWEDFIDAGYVSKLDPQADPMWRREWRAKGRKGWGAQITNRANDVFELIKHRHQTLASEVDVLFPSSNGRQYQHIRSIDHVWRRALAQHSLPYVSPRRAKIFYNAARWGHWEEQDRLYTPGQAK